MRSGRANSDKLPYTTLSWKHDSFLGCFVTDWEGWGRIAGGGFKKSFYGNNSNTGRENPSWDVQVSPLSSVLFCFAGVFSPVPAKIGNSVVLRQISPQVVLRLPVYKCRAYHIEPLVT